MKSAVKTNTLHVLATVLLHVFGVIVFAQSVLADDLPNAPVPEKPPVSSPGDSLTGFVWAGTAEYQQHFGSVIETGAGATGGRIEISFEPTVSYLPMRVAIDLGSKQVTQADVTMLRAWIFNLVSYHRNLDANVASDLEVLKVTVPLVTESWGGPSALVNMVVKVGGSNGYRWMNDGNSGSYFTPFVAASVSANILNRLFASVFAQASATLITGSEKNYVSADAGGQIAFGLTSDNMLRLAINGSVNYDGANASEGLPTVSEYLGAGLIWGAQPSIAERDFDDGEQR